MQDELADRVKALGWIEVDRGRVDDAFPRPTDGLPQPEQIAAWCQEHGFGHEWNGEADRLRLFRA